MKLINEPGLACDLEAGLGEFHWLPAAFEPSLRLRLPVCGLSSLALVKAMQENGIDAEAMISAPNIPSHPDLLHVFVNVNVNSETYIIDPTYSQFLDMTGLSPGYVVFGGEDLFPARRIEVFRSDDRQRVATELAQTAVNFRRIGVPIAELKHSLYPMIDHTFDEMTEEYSEIWNPDYFDTFVTDEPDMKKLVPKVASMISPEHARLVA